MACSVLAFLFFFVVRLLPVILNARVEGYSHNPRSRRAHRSNHVLFIWASYALNFLFETADDSMARATAAFRVKLNRLLDHSYLREIQNQASSSSVPVFW